MNFLILTQGCKVNQYDSGIISAAMLSEGYTRAEENDIPDIVIVNTCTVTENGDKKARRLISKLRRDYPSAIVVVTGCYPQAFPEEAALDKYADIVTGNSENKSIPSLIAEFAESRAQKSCVKPHEREFYEPEEFFHSDKTRAFVKIEDGCDRFCSYCIIPAARGRIRSRGLDNIVKEIRFHAADGHKEIVLTGINLSCYGSDIGLSLYDAVKAAAEEPLIERVRLSSLEPELLTPKEINRLASVEKLCPHFHLSLQSGCDSTLKRMNRHYTAAEYEEITENLRKAFPGCAVTTDIMTGFAGETEAEFESSLRFAERIGFARIHVFTYSVRPGTAAALMPNQVPERVKAERYNRMTELARRSRRSFFEKNLGTVHKALIERQTSPDYINGYTESYIPVRIYGGKGKRHDIVRVRLTDVEEDFCVGTEI
ncbi:MAG: tRNA (N(6)-L-threonylcarbamoyladenosine(37)-C(2))-methylthiotransferase MtaB [Bacteroides sp.]|nr:tRNA (N(6)-L-threonylcarbamoyladenosine(37)-C(2))-methylthiotransferase MtaB [Bacteroides sp.]